MEQSFRMIRNTLFTRSTNGFFLVNLGTFFEQTVHAQNPNKSTKRFFFGFTLKYTRVGQWENIIEELAKHSSKFLSFRGCCHGVIWYIYLIFKKKRLKQNRNPKKKKREFRKIVCQARLHRQSNATVYNKSTSAQRGKRNQNEKNHRIQTF